MHEDDRDSGWKPSSDDNGRIFVNARGWTCSDMQDTELTYDEAEQFLRFVDKYVVRAVGVHFLSQWSKSHRSKTILEKVTASDIAYTILVYENSREVWEEELEIKDNAATEEDRRKAIRHKKPKYHGGRGKRVARFGDGWIDSGREYYKELLGIFQSLKFNTKWKTLEEHWTFYQMKHYKKGDTRRDDSVSGQDEGCEDENDDDDWQIEMADDEEGAELNDDMSDDDGDEPPRNRLRMTM